MKIAIVPVLAFLFSASALFAAAPDESEPAPKADLAQWLADKDVVVVRFRGPEQAPGRAMSPREIDVFVKTASSLSPDDFPKVRFADKVTLPPDFHITHTSDFRVVPKPLHRDVLEVKMKVTPESTRYVLALRTFLEAKDFHVDPQAFRYSVIAYRCDEKTREEARQLIPQCLDDFTKALKTKYPNAESKLKDLAKAKKSELTESGQQIAAAAGEQFWLTYSIPDTKVVGQIHVAPLSVSWRPYISLAPRQEFRLQHLGLFISTYQWPLGEKDDTREPIAKMIEESLAPLLKLERAAGGDTSRERTREGVRRVE
jgi:hypothetical protein